MAACFVIQPFDSGKKYDKRYLDIFEPAIAAAGLTAYRVDQDRSADILIDTIEQQISEAAICLADISTDNPNVWYELGYAFSSNRPVVMVCSEERTDKFPFDIQHRKVIRYLAESRSDFDKLQAEITETIKERLNKQETLRQISETQQVAPVHGLTQPELAMLAVIATKASPSQSMLAWSAKTEVERAGFTGLAFALGFRGLQSKLMLESTEIEDEDGHPHDAVRITERGWRWIEANQSLFSLKRPKKSADDLANDIPF